MSIALNNQHLAWIRDRAKQAYADAAKAEAAYHALRQQYEQIHSMALAAGVEGAELAADRREVEMA